MGRNRGILDHVNLALFGGAKFSAAEFDAMIAAEGNSGEFRRCLTCPCVRLDPRTPEAKCPHCRGLGWIYPESLREPMIVLDQQRNATGKFSGAGEVVDGTVQATFPSGVVPGFGDMWRPDGEEHVVVETLHRNGSQRVTDAMLRPHRLSPDQVPPVLTGRKERLLYPDPCCIEHVSYLVRGDGLESRLATAGPLEYDVDADGRWSWIGNTGPAPGDAWTVRYRAPAVYVVYSAKPRFRSESDKRMPQLVTMRRLDKVSHEDLRT